MIGAIADGSPFDVGSDACGRLSNASPLPVCPAPTPTKISDTRFDRHSSLERVAPVEFENHLTVWKEELGPSV